MSIETRQNLTKFLRSYSDANAGRPTRLGVFEKTADCVSDYWIEDGLPFVGIDADGGGRSDAVQIFAGHMTHNIPHAEKITFHLDLVHGEDGFDVIGMDGKVTILRFEKPTQ